MKGAQSKRAAQEAAKKKAEEAKGGKATEELHKGVQELAENNPEALKELAEQAEQEQAEQAEGLNFEEVAADWEYKPLKEKGDTFTGIFVRFHSKQFNDDYVDGIEMQPVDEKTGEILRSHNVMIGDYYTISEAIQTAIDNEEDMKRTVWQFENVGKKKLKGGRELVQWKVRKAVI